MGQPEKWLASFASCDLLGVGEACFGLEAIDLGGVYVALLAFLEGLLGAPDGLLGLSIVDLLYIQGLIGENRNLVSIYLDETRADSKPLVLLVSADDLDLARHKFCEEGNVMRQDVYATFRGREANFVHGFRVNLGVGSYYLEEERHGDGAFGW